MKAAAEGHAMESNSKKLNIAKPTDLIPFFKAEEILKRRFPDTTREEIEMWTFLGSIAFPDENDEWVVIGPNAGGFTSYFRDSANASTVDSLIFCGQDIGEKQVGARLAKSKFSSAEIEAFNPDERWISYRTLLEQWAERIGEKDAEAIIDDSAVTGELEEFHPFTKDYKTKQAAIFSLNQIRLVENNVFPAVAETKTTIEETAKVEMPLVEPSTVRVTPSVTALPILRQQEKQILEWLKANGYDPKKLPKRKNGHGTVKVFARAALQGKGPFEKPTTFKKAWDRLREGEEIQEEESSYNPTPPK